MMLIFGIFIIAGGLVEMILTSFSFSSLILVVFGLLLVIVNLAGSKVSRGIGKNILSLLVVLIGLVAVIGLSSIEKPLDKETRDILDEAEDIYATMGYEEAIDYIEKTNMESGWKKETALMIGKLYMDQSMYAEGARAYYHVLKRMPEDMAVRTLYAEALYKNKDYNNTLKEGLYMAKLDPGYAKAYIVIGDAYRGYKDHFREIFYYKIAVGLDEESIVSRIRLAEAYGKSHSKEEAIEQYEIAKELAESFEEETQVYESYLRFSEIGRQETGQEVE